MRALLALLLLPAAAGASDMYQAPVSSPGISTGAATTAALTGNGQSGNPLGVNSSSVPVFNSERNLVLPYGLTAATGSFSGGVTVDSVTATGNSSVVGNLGIGQAHSATIGLDVKKAIARFWTLGAHSLRWGNGNVEFFEWLSGTSGGTILNNNTSAHSGGYIAIPTSGAATMALMPTSGSVGIGTASPATTLDVNGNAQFGSGANKSTFTTTGRLEMNGGQWLTVDKIKGVSGNIVIYDATEGNRALVPSATRTGISIDGVPTNVGGNFTAQTTMEVEGSFSAGSGATKSTFTATGDLNVGGIISAPSQPFISLWAPSGLVSNAALTPIFWSQVSTNTGMGYDAVNSSDTVTVPVAGLYDIRCSGYSTTATSEMAVGISINNIAKGKIYCDPINTSESGCEVAKIYGLLAGDAVNCKYYQAGAGNIQGSENQSFFQVYKLP